MENDESTRREEAALHLTEKIAILKGILMAMIKFGKKEPDFAEETAMDSILEEVLAHLFEIRAERCVEILIRLDARVIEQPGRSGGRIGRKAVVVDGSEQHLSDRDDKGQQHEQEQRRDQHKGAATRAQLRPGQSRLQWHAFGCGQRCGGV